MTLAAVVPAALGVFLLAAAAQALTGFGFAVVAVPVLAAVVDPVTAVVATTVLSLFLTARAAVVERAHIERPVAVRFTVSGLVGIPLGLLVLSRLDGRALELLMAAGISVLVVLFWLRVRIPAGLAAQRGAGLLSGMLLAATGMNGPPVVLVAQALELPPRRFRGTLQAIFCAQDLVAVCGFAGLGHVRSLTIAVVAAGVAGVPLGWRIGNRLFAAVPAARFRAVVLAMLTLTAAGALWSALG